MKKVLAALRAVLADVLLLQDKQLAGLVAAGVVAIVARVAGVHLTVAEVTGWLAIAVLLAGVVEKLLPSTPAQPKK